jgi:hypothetical protein
MEKSNEHHMFTVKSKEKYTKEVENQGKEIKLNNQLKHTKSKFNTNPIRYPEYHFDPLTWFTF